MPTVPLWLTPGNGPFTVSLTPQTVNSSSGALSDGTAVPLVGDLHDVRHRIGVTHINVRAMNRKVANNIIVERALTITLVEILKSAGTNLLAAQNNTSDYFKIIITRGAQAWTAYMVAGDMGEEYPEEGPSLCTWDLVQCDSGGAVVTYA